MDFVTTYTLDSDIRRIAIYPVDSAIHLLNNRGQNVRSILAALSSDFSAHHFERRKDPVG